jgi:multisubunit Na+/H+ antiporter MnhF subunit
VAAGWFLGYAGTWVTKWALAIWLSDNAAGEAANILNQVAFRLDGLEAGSTMFRIPLAPTISMILKAFESVGTILVIPIIAAVLIHVRGNQQSFDRAYFYQLVSPISITFLWFELLSNHTQLHPNFVYRSASTAIALVLAAGIISSDAPVSIASLWINLRRFVCPPECAA